MLGLCCWHAEVGTVFEGVLTSLLIHCVMATEWLWRIPFVDSTKLNPLCIGFIRECNINLLKDDKIVNTTMDYIDHETDLLKQIKNAKVKQGFKSQIFTVDSFKWMIELIPNSLRVK